MRKIAGARGSWILCSLLVLAGCAGNRMQLDLRGTVMYEKPQIREISHALTGAPDEGTVVVEVTLRGDPGLTATFDITPGIAQREAMTEVEDGHYEGTFSFARDVYGGPYWVTGRLRHERAGEHVLRDPAPVMIALPDR